MSHPVLVAVDPKALFTVPEAVPFTAAAVEELDPFAPNVNVIDLSVTRGDGVFETVAVLDGVPIALGPHLERLGRSARICDLPRPNLAAFEAAVRRVVALHGADEDLHVKIVVSRGLDTSTTAGARLDTGLPEVWIHADRMPDHGAQLAVGAKAVTLSRGITREAAATAPWLELGAKTLSYAANKAAQREVERRGADEAVFVTADGYVLEGPTASVVLRRGDEFVTPDPAIGILHGTTQQEFFGYLGYLGFATSYADVTVEELRAADQLWILGSGLSALAIVELDGRPVATDLAFTATANAFIRTERDLVEKYRH